ncbi:MAG: hypothetical protein QM774_06420 [Gordonia sp. (in: high G+C Gram-positive bacteria)]|uniref:hypothetical protein n=1 Tax=Gordonia sp. (in: high G+C Gram-positive bacteria) TaxID=84139 RepID=UPI0039E6F43A
MTTRTLIASLIVAVSVPVLAACATAGGPKIGSAPQVEGQKQFDGNAQAAGATQVVNLIAVGKDGEAASGWTVDPAASERVYCDPITPSRSAVTPGLYECSPNAAGANTCWASSTTPYGLLCGMSPWTKELRRFTSNNVLTAVGKIDDPQPWGLELVDGTRCELRHGGAWGGRSDDLVGAYSCDKDHVYVLTADEHAVDKSQPTWTVKTGDLGRPDQQFPAATVVGVRTAVFAAAADGSAA